MKRQMIQFTHIQHEYLLAEAHRLGISTPELVRRIIDVYREYFAVLNELRLSSANLDRILKFSISDKPGDL